MKKTSLLFVILMIAFSSVKAQFSENFNTVADGAMPVGWTVFNVDGLTPYADVNFVTNAWVAYTLDQVLPTQAAWSTSYYTPAGTANDWMFTPAVLVPATNAQLRYTVVTPNASYPDGYQLRVMTDAPTAANLMTSTVLLNVSAAETTPTTKVIDLSAYAGQTVYFGWRNNSNDMVVLGIDDVVIKSFDNNDAAVAAVNTASILPVGNSNITGTIRNMGFNSITSYDVTYKIDGGTASAVYSVTGANIASNGTGTFTHNIPANLTIGSHTIEVTISNVNGSTDPNLADNVISKTVSVASQTVPKMCLFEGYSSSTCAPCASWNATFNPWAATNEANMNYIKYQVNWPGTGDPYYFAQTGTRVSYYGVNAAPDMYANGVNMSSLSVAALNTAVAKAASENAVFNISCTPTYFGDMLSVPVTIDPYVTASGLKVHVVVCEKVTTGNHASNGETSFHHVMMQMLPTAAGSTVNFTDGVAYTNTLTKDMSGTFVEEMSDLMIIVFIQDDVTKEVLQSKTFSSVPLTVENETMGNISIYPNPAKDNIHIKNAENSNIVICDVLGKVVLSESNISNDFNMNVSGLAKGNYVVKIMNGNQFVTKKITILN